MNKILDDLDTGVDVGLPAAAAVVSVGCIVLLVAAGIVAVLVGLMIAAGGW